MANCWPSFVDRGWPGVWENFLVKVPVGIKFLLASLTIKVDVLERTRGAGQVATGESVWGYNFTQAL